jgi:nicotinamide-nucleotide amidase
MAVIAAAHIVVVGPRSGAADDGLADLIARLTAIGVPVRARTYVEDDDAALEHVLTPPARLALIVAGAGGSAGDVVRRVLARIAGVRLVLSERMLDALSESARRRERPLARRAERLALLPQGATLWLTAAADPAWLLECGGRAFAVLPRGSDLSVIVAEHLVPWIEAHVGGRAGLALRTLRVAGVPLADVEERLGADLGTVSVESGAVDVSVVAAEADVWVRLRARGATPAAAEQALGEVERRVAGALGDDCYGRDADSMERVVGRLLRERELTVSVAESCTGGLLGHRLTNVPGSSAYFERGVMAYSNRAKQELLGVPEAVLRAHGAVSAPCAEAMARGIVKASGSACGLAVTGIAGPDGGTREKPVGTVFIGVAVGEDVSTRRVRLDGDRASIKWQSTQVALDLLRRRLLRA